MKLTKKEEYLVFRVLLYKQFRIAGAEKLLEKLLLANPEWQRLIDKKLKSDKELEEFRRKVRG